MADWGLLSGLGKGLKEGFDSFRENERYKEDKLKRDEADAFTKALQMKQIKDSGYEYNPETKEIFRSEEGKKDKLSKTLKTQLDLQTQAYKALPEDARQGTREGQELWNNISSLTKKLGAIYSGEEPGEVSNSVVTQAKESVRPKGLISREKPKVSTFLGQPMQNASPAGEEPPRASEENIPGLIRASKGFLPGKLSKKDQEFNQALRKKAAEITIDKELGTPKQNESAAAEFALRIEEAMEAMEALEASGYNRRDKMQGYQSGFTDPVIARLPWGLGEPFAAALSGGARASGLLNPKFLQNRQAEQNFATAALRKESGSSITPSEFSTAEEIYFPRVGDSDELVDQKRETRRSKLAALKAEAGKAYERVKELKNKEKQNRKKGLLNK